MYTKKGGPPRCATVVAVHTEDPAGAYYDIKFDDSSNEVQTIESRLAAPPQGRRLAANNGGAAPNNAVPRSPVQQLPVQQQPEHDVAVAAEARARATFNSGADRNVAWTHHFDIHPLATAAARQCPPGWQASRHVQRFCQSAMASNVRAPAASPVQFEAECVRLHVPVGGGRPAGNVHRPHRVGERPVADP